MRVQAPPCPSSVCQTSCRQGKPISTSIRPRAAGQRRGTLAAAAGGSKVVWLETTNKDALTAGLEAGFSTAVFGADAEQRGRARDWQALGRFEALTRAADGSLVDAAGKAVGRVRLLSCPEDLRAAEKEAATDEGFVVMDAEDWQIIPAENLVAAYQHNPRATLLAAARDAASGRVMLEALEAGTDGVLLRTDSPAEVRALARYLREREQAGARLRYETAMVCSVRPVGMGDRACVDLCSLLAPGEGLLVGSFARGLFLVHSECAESQYIASRPFRVNAGPVHAYLQLPAGRTGYLAELKSGAEVLVADADGSTRSALVGRVKIESRPLVLVEAELPDGDRCSVLLQNAETVRLVGPAGPASSHSSGGSSGGNHGHPAAGAAREKAVASAASSADAAVADVGRVGQQGGNGSAAAASAAGPAQLDWQAVSVSQLAPGHRLFVLRQDGARHTGVSIQGVAISER
ncbi:hypothetical protein ABPG77_004553 [Micractinium sp. CCAP 211/92]